MARNRKYGMIGENDVGIFSKLFGGRKTKSHPLPAIESIHVRTDFVNFDGGPTKGPGGPECDAALPIWNSGNYDQAFEHFARAVELGLEGPDLADALGMMGNVKLMQDDILKGVEFMLRALATPERAAETVFICSSHLTPIYEGVGDNASAAALKLLVQETPRGMELDSETATRLRKIARNLIQ